MRGTEASLLVCLFVVLSLMKPAALPELSSDSRAQLALEAVLSSCRSGTARFCVDDIFFDM